MNYGSFEMKQYKSTHQACIQSKNEFMTKLILTHHL